MFVSIASLSIVVPTSRALSARPLDGPGSHGGLIVSGVTTLYNSASSEGLDGLDGRIGLGALDGLDLSSQ